MEEKARAEATLVCRWIHEFHEKQDVGVLRMLIALLMNVQISVPMTISMEDADVEKFLHSRAGDTVTTDGAIRMKPDMLKNGAGDLFFPAFTLKEETPENYRNSFSWITMDFMNCVHHAFPNENCAGVVVNGFSESFVVTRQMMKLMLDLETAREQKS